MKLLPSILGFTRGLLPNAANLHRLIEMLLASDSSLFEYCVLFGSKSGTAFVPLHVEPWDRKAADLRGWPLEFAIAKRKARLIAQRGGDRQSLAIPFSVSALERYVVLAVLRRGALSESDRHFLRAIACVSDRVPEVRTHRAHDLELREMMPHLTVAYFGNSQMDERCADLFSAWGWTVSHLSYTAAGAPSHEADLIVVDGVSVSRSAPALRALRAAQPRAMIVYLGPPTAGAEALADDILRPDASSLSAGRTFKRIARELQDDRRRAIEAKVLQGCAQLLSVGSVPELTERFATLLTGTVADWASVHIVDDSGTAYNAEMPESAVPVLPELPDYFLAGYSLLKPHADDDFFREICNDEEAQRRLAALKPVSAAAVPIMGDDTLIGCAIVLSSREPYEAAHFDIITRAAVAAGTAYLEFDRKKRQARRAPAQTAVCNGYQADAYSGPESAAQAYVSVNAPQIGIELSGSSGLRLNGRIDTMTGLLIYDGEHLAEPLVVSGAGTLQILPVHGRDRRIALTPGSAVLLYPASMTAAVRENGIAALLKNLVEKKQRHLRRALADALGAAAAFIAVSAAQD